MDTTWIYPSAGARCMYSLEGPRRRVRCSALYLILLHRTRTVASRPSKPSRRSDTSRWDQALDPTEDIVANVNNGDSVVPGVSDEQRLTIRGERETGGGCSRMCPLVWSQRNRIHYGVAAGVDHRDRVAVPVRNVYSAAARVGEQVVRVCTDPQLAGTPHILFPHVD